VSPRRAIHIVIITALLLTLLAPIYQASAQAGATAWVNTGRLNVRTGPGVNYNSITSLLRNSAVTMIGRTADASWIQVVIPGGTQGWMRSRFLLSNIAIGNLPITWAVPPAPPPSVPPTGGTIHVVQPGENLFRIALRYGLTWDVVAAANGLFNANFVFAGQRLIIPAGGTVPPPATGGPIVHIVQSGESLLTIAARYGTTWQAIAAANNLANANYIFPGQRLNIPAGGPPPQPRTYTVQRGDNLTAIAVRFGTTVQVIMTANNIANPNFIAPGQVLTIP
jgi:LysM repeat protein